MIIAALMSLLIWFVILLLRIVIKADRQGSSEADLGLFAYKETKETPVAKPAQRKKLRA